MTPEQDLEILVKNYLRNEPDYELPSFNEAQLRQQYLDPFFEILGWDVSNKEGYSEEYKEVIHEDSILVEGHKKAPDYCFKIGRERKFFVEAKKPAVDIRTDVASAYQLRRYAWSAQLPFSILSNFKYFSVYDTLFKPEKEDKASKARIAIHEISNFKMWWPGFISQFSKQEILRGAFQREAKVGSRTGSTTVDIQFLEEIEGWRLALANDLRLRNKSLSAQQINTVTQLTIDRILFLRICEDRAIEPLGHLKKRVSGKKKYLQLLGVFAEAQRRYNSGLFHLLAEPMQKYPQDDLSRSVVIGDEIPDKIVGSLYFPECPYEFSVFPSDLLGQVYERFLGSEITFDGARNVKVELKPEVKKSGGVYYTPTYVVRYIVDKTLSGRFPNVESRDRPKFSILDMACGSGNFLIEAYDYLLRWYLQWHSNNPKSTSVTRIPRWSGSGYDLRLTLSERKRILLDHIFGVDIDDQAVEVTRLSLLMKILEDPLVVPKQMEFGVMQSRLLPDLYENVVCGNSLVDHDLYSIDLLGIEESDESKINAFNWESVPKFSRILQAGGFDAIVGNPPYSYRNSTIEKLKPYYEEKYKTHEGNYDTYKYFLERGCELLKKGGSQGQIVNASFLIQPQFEKLRRYLDANMRFRELSAMGSNVFPKVTIDTAILIAEKRRRSARTGVELIEVREPANPMDLLSTPHWHIDQSRLKETPAFAIDWRLDKEGYALVQKLLGRHGSLQDYCDLSVGINTGSMRDKMIADRKIDDTYHPCIGGKGLSWYGSVSTIGWIAYDQALVKAAGKAGRSLPPERFFNSPKILVVRTRNVSLPRRIVATIDTNNFYNLNRLSNILPKPGTDIYTILGFLNSKLVNWLFRTRFFNYEIKPVFLKELPIPAGDDSVLSELVERRLAVGSDQGPASHQDYARRLRKADALEHQIELRVQELYGVTAEECQIYGSALSNASDSEALDADDCYNDGES